MATATVSVLFTDLVGSTELMSRVGPERADDLRRQHFGALRSAIAGRGREVKNLGDGLMVVFDSVTAALACAAAMQQAIDRRNRKAGDEELSVRIGVSSGEAEIEDGDYFGVPVVEAARLCSRAEGTEILATDLVRLLAGSRGEFEFDPVGELRLKGLDEPVRTWRVAWTPVDPPDQLGVPVPPRVRAAGEASFVGRAPQLDLLRSAFQRAEVSGRQLVLLAGEPGVGKTSIACALAQEVAADGAVVLYGRCDEDLGIPYQPWAEAFTYLVAHAPGEVVDAHVRERRAELGTLAPTLAARVGVEATRSAGEGEAERFMLFGAAVDLLTRVCDLAPVVLLLDDLHWADRPSAQLLRHVMSAGTGLRLLVIGTFRDSEVDVDHPLAETLAALHRETGVERLTVPGLGGGELLDLVEATTGRMAADAGVALRDALESETGGNPFFAGEIVRHLAETGALYQEPDGLWSMAADLDATTLPVSVREVVLSRVARLGDDTRRVLSMAAVIGRDFDLDLLARVMDTDEDRLLDLLEGATAAGVIAEAEAAGRFTFAHALIEHTLYAEQSAARRSRAHCAIGVALEDLCGDRPEARAGELAYHWATTAEAKAEDRPVRYAQLAGDRALAGQAPEEAARWYRQALDRLEARPTGEDEPRHRAELLIGLGEAQRRLGDAGHRETLLVAADLADSLDDSDLLTRAAIANNRGWSSGTGLIDEDRIRVVRRALERLGQVDTPERARLLAVLCAELLFGAPVEERLALAEEAIAVARRTGDRFALLDALIRVQESVVVPQTLELRLAWVEEARQLGDRLDDHVLRGMAYVYKHLTALEACDLHWVRRGLDEVDVEAEHIGQATYRWIAAVQRSCERALAGDLVEAEQDAGRAFQLGAQGGQPDAAGAFGMQVLSLRWMQGRLAEVVPMVEQTSAALSGVPAMRGGLAFAYAESGQLDEARTMLDTELETKIEHHGGSGWLATHAIWSLVACHTGHAAAAELLRERLGPWREQFISTHLTTYGPVAYPVGLLEALLGRHDEAEADFALALAINERMEAPFFIALTKVAWARMLAERGEGDDVDRAQAMAADALSLAVEGGFGALERQAAALNGRAASRKG